MRATGLAIPEVVLIDPTVFEDQRGFFMESWHRDALADALASRVDFVQDNHSMSVKGVLRGLHFQAEPHPQGKLVRVVSGSVWDVAVDIRRSSPSFAEWVAVELSSENHRQLWIPPGFAHGFLALTDRADMIYKVTDYYSGELDRSIRWDDPDIGIDWPLEGEPTISDKDAAAPYLRDAEVFA
jgi:dTDP-4-dehydrorhamnose 3,5-epimerase